MLPCTGMTALAVAFWNLQTLPSDFSQLPRCREIQCSRKRLQNSVPSWHQIADSDLLLTSDGRKMPLHSYCGHVAGPCWDLGHQFASSWDVEHSAAHSPQNVYPESRTHMHIGNKFPSSGHCTCRTLQCHNDAGDAA